METPILKSKVSRVSNGTVRLFMIGVNSAKDVVNGFMTTKEVGPGYMHYPKKDIYNLDYWKQLTAEKRDKATGRWSKFRNRNEAFDVRVYSMAVLKILENEYYPSGMDCDEIEEEFNYRVEEVLNNIDYEPQSEESTGTDGIHDWRDNY